MAPHPATEKSRHRFSVEPLLRLFRATRRLLTRSTGIPLHSNPIHRDADKDSRHLRASDKRQNPRIHLTGTTVHVTDGCLFASALIENISLCGICLGNLPEQLYRSARQLTVFSSDNPGIPILHIQPKWESTGWDGKTIGATILNASETWGLFIAHTASQIEN